MRLRYLQAMGIQAWVLRQPVGEADSNAAPADEDELWRRLLDEIAHCTACDLHQTRTHTVPGTGDHHADWMLIGEGPGEQEDLKGEPFVGRAGKLLDEMIRALGYRREQVYITNAVKCRPPGNRDPKPEEVAACEPFLQRQIALVRPRIILAVGRIAAQALLRTKVPLARLRGKVHDYDGIPLIVIYHPAYLLRNPAAKRQAWEDLKFAWRVYQQRLQEADG
ncbi:uracil-DNA glycosylase [Methylomarinovum caldicuralii]|uniref:uracil-DNA glycosylase n=1 Tax=Methylomarinovum caldicuralii TaxID=438856 RepID=UPI0029554650|nr:uracil-DNA glycosylase [Methylomarinovum caldicuralii]